MVAISLYHGGRLFSYTLIGAICGHLGKQPLKWFFHSPAAALPWAFVVVLVLIGLGLDKRLPRPLFLTRLTARWRMKTWRLPPAAGAALTGLITPLLPCGPLYAVFFTLMTAGSAAAGAETALGFGLGTVPLLWLTQLGFRRWRDRIPLRRLPAFQRGLALVAAAVMAWRLHAVPPFPQATVAGDSPLPSCCHE